jgi:hypothetical protein
MKRASKLSKSDKSLSLLPDRHLKFVCVGNRFKLNLVFNKTHETKAKQQYSE